MADNLPSKSTDKSQSASKAPADSPKSAASDKAPVDTAKPKGAAQRTTAAGAAQPVAQSKKQGAGALLWSFVLLNFLLLLAAAAGGYWFWQQYQANTSQSDTLTTQFETLRSDLVQQKSEQTRMLESLSVQQKSVDQAMIDELNATKQQVEFNQSQLADISGRRPSDWILAEADYLVRMAGRKLWLEGDERTAVLMLQEADKRLQEMADPSLYPIRQLLAADIQTLQQLNPVDETNIALALAGIVRQVDNLPLALPEIPELTPKDIELSNSIDDAGENFSKTLSFLKDLFQYQPRNTPIRPMLTQQQQWLAREQLKLSLLQAQSAALDRHETLFQQSLQTSISLLVDHFDLDSTPVSQFTESLTNLQNTRIERSLPARLSAAQPLSDLITSRISSVRRSEADVL